MSHPVRTTLLALLSVAAPAGAQLEQVGFTDTSFRNPTSSGSAQLRVRVHYPAQRAGRDAPLKARTGGWPALVFLHGLGARGTFYSALGGHFAARGYIAVMNDTGQFSSNTQALDAVALFHALRSENVRAGGFFRGAFDTRRVGVGGHSMGGGNTIRTLANNPGYRAGFGLAPWDHGFSDYPTRYSPLVRVPFLIIHGEGDTTVNWQTSGLRFWQLATGYTGIKVMYRLDPRGTHNNIAFPFSSSRSIYDRSMAVATGFLDTYVKGSATGLEQVLGAPARGEPALRRIYLEVDGPPLWRTGSTAIGGVATLRVAGESGAAALALAAGRSSTATPFGTLLLDPATLVIARSGAVDANGLLSTTLAIPNDADLIGRAIPFQGIATNRRRELRLTGAVDLTPTR